MRTINMELKDESSFGERLRNVRQKLKLSQKDFAANLNVSGPALSEFENDKYRPGYEFFYLIVKNFKVNLYYLLFDEGEMFTETMGGLHARLAEAAASSKELRRFLYYLEKSPLVQYNMLSQFRRFYMDEKETIERDVVAFKDD